MQCVQTSWISIRGGEKMHAGQSIFTSILMSHTIRRNELSRLPRRYSSIVNGTHPRGIIPGEKGKVWDDLDTLDDFMGTKDKGYRVVVILVGS